MSIPTPACEIVTVSAFLGDRTRPFVTQFLQKLDDEKNGRGPGPTMIECQLYAGHTGISLDGGATIFGFNLNPRGKLAWQLMDDLKRGLAFDGIVNNDTAAFVATQSRGLQAISFDVRVPPATFQDFKDELDSERRSSKYKYGFPNGDGDCNCTTWLERLGLPLLTGRMNEFVNLSEPPVRQVRLGDIFNAPDTAHGTDRRRAARAACVSIPRRAARG